MPFSRRSEIAELWRRGARLIRADIFGPDDPLRPVYENRGNLDWQVDVTVVGMVGCRSWRDALQGRVPAVQAALES